MTREVTLFCASVLFATLLLSAAHHILISFNLDTLMILSVIRGASQVTVTVLISLRSVLASEPKSGKEVNRE